MTEIDVARNLPRRTVLRGAILAGSAVPFLAACSSGDSTDTSSPDPTEEATSPSESNPSSGGGGAEPIATTADVPEGGGLILKEAAIVITQPATGDFKGFTSICTHQGCPVDNVSEGTINCLCHGSKFSVEDGSVVNGPATAPLAEMAITVEGDAITLA